MRYIAVISCTYLGDSPAFLDEMLSSVFKAKLPNEVELNFYLHVDGILTKKHEEILSKYNIYKRVDSPYSVGLAHGLNKLILMLENEDYIFRMDSDDICSEDRFVKQISFMDTNSTVDISGGSIEEFIGNTLNIVAKRVYPSSRLENHLLKCSPLAHVTVCFRKGFFERFGFYPTEFPLNEDIAYWFRSFSQGAFGANINDVLVRVRMDGAYKRRSFKKSISELKVYLLISRWKRKVPFFPIARFLFRLLPPPIIERIYNSKLRTNFLKD
ncbi:glycosyltransferase [Xenorhabdus bovienii]|uniref:Glycosyltransferase n=1 Tax=Xenorhabdus bovienii TaxID=40576 RepID=A0AAJ1J9D3_XENBV|nr:glycosyltransferase [Xenorhabdus bovienii]MDE1478537.1 glycosyltransferase [Xenorhabdus bovienii]MDE9510255.1 glycosyltransferase [Xenorhabdus bovienii]MDE9521896.1 glycosyltransferase [Xenorhabdus bovienii]